MDQLHAQVRELGRAQALELGRGGLRLERLGLLDQRADHEALPPRGDLLADALVGARPRAGAVDHVGLHRLTSARQLAQHGRVEVSVRGERERARDRRRGHVERVRDETLGRLRVERRALAHAEAVLLVHDHDGEVAELHRLLDQRVSAHHELELPVRQPVEQLAPPRGARGAGEELHRQLAAEQRVERAVVLLGERLGRRHQRRLGAVLDRAQHRRQRYDRVVCDREVVSDVKLVWVRNRNALHRLLPRVLNAHDGLCRVRVFGPRA